MNVRVIKCIVALLSLIFQILSFSPFFSGQGFAGILSDEKLASRDSVIKELQQVLDNEFKTFYPVSIDTLFGGFFSDLDYQWKLDGEQNKMIVTQARHVWSTANAGMFYQKDNRLREIAGHGVKFLKEKMWDRELGGFYNLVTRKGEPIQEAGSIIKSAYGNAFAIYGLAAYFWASGDTAALNLAKETFWWLEKHSYDPRYGGYFQFITREGVPFKDGRGPVAAKDQNSSIHLLESFTELYKVWPDSLLKTRLESLLKIIRDSLVTEKGHINLFFKQDWTPISYKDSSSEVQKNNYYYDHISFGHDIEIAYLMLEASEALELKHDATTLAVAKKMVDHVLKYGVDEKNGGVYDGGYYFNGDRKPTITRKSKEWWSQAEALNSLLMMSELFPDDSPQYYRNFIKQWEYCKRYLIDPDHNGWYWSGVDITPGMKYSAKGSIWKCNYHTSRALINCINRLKHQGIFSDQKQFSPVNKNTTPEARKLLERLYSVRGKKIISGHQNYVGRIDTYPDRVKELTGKLPEIWGCDFAGYFNKGYMDALIQAAYGKFKEGYIITLMWHVGRPQDDPPFGWKESVQAEITDKEWKELITPGTELNSRWTKRVDSIAQYLHQLQILGVPVLWRPFHELNGVWFWWGNRKGENGSAKLYKMMFDRFIHYHKLNNLIWVWNANAPRQLINDEAYAYEDYFPGLDYVDVLAADVYNNDYRQSHHDELVRLSRGKVIALGEVGEVPNPDILACQPMWVWFMVWGDFVDTHNTPQQIKALYDYPGVLTHKDFITNK